MILGVALRRESFVVNGQGMFVQQVGMVITEGVIIAELVFVGMYWMGDLWTAILVAVGALVKELHAMAT